MENRRQKVIMLVQESDGLTWYRRGRRVGI